MKEKTRRNIGRVLAIFMVISMVLFLLVPYVSGY